MSFSSIADARNAVHRLQEVFTAELVTESIIQDSDLKNAIEVESASFTWDSAPPDVAAKLSKKKTRAAAAAAAAAPTPVSSEPPKEENLFKLKDVDLKVPRGQLVAIVGAVGAGKTSLLQGMIGEMRRTAGTVKFGGSIAYCSQSAWIQVRIFKPLRRIWFDLCMTERHDPREHLLWTTV